MEIQPQFLNILPVEAIADEVNRSLRRVPRLIVTAPPGSGKSTLLPITIAQDIPEGKIILLEPRRAAARQIAMRLASMIGEKPGGTVGYRMRFESKVSASTKIEVVTEGVLERMLVQDATMAGISAVIFDEYHERSLSADLTLALAREAQSILRPDLRIVIMSATIDTGSLATEFDAPVIEAQGHMFDVEIRHADTDADLHGCASQVASAVAAAYRTHEGNILAFLPGQAEISRCMELLKDRIADAEIIPLHGMLPPQEQYKALEFSADGKRKIVLATPIAETSLTIQGVSIVVDSGFYRSAVFNNTTGLTQLVTSRISLDMARQRTGRAGRLSSGICYRLWTKATEHRMAENRTPEILEADLTGLTLSIAAWGGESPEQLPWTTPPPQSHLKEAKKLLELLGAIDSRGKITPHGRRMAALPCHPRIANLLVSATDDRLRALAADIAAILEEKDPLNDENNADINHRIASLRIHRREDRQGQWKRIMLIAQQYRNMTRCKPDNSLHFTADETALLIAAAYPERVGMRMPDGTYRLPGGESVRINESDNISASEFLSIASMTRRILLASPVSRSELRLLANPYDNISWNSREGKLIARREQRIGILVVDSKPLTEISSEQIAGIVAQAAIKEGRSMFSISDEVIRLIQRINTAREWHPELKIPPISINSIFESAREWLPFYIDRNVNVQSLRKIDLCEVVTNTLGYELMETINRIAPTHLRLPVGKTVKIEYREASSAPVVSARIQDCFGLHDTPRIDNGSRPLLVELLSPGFKPVQLTQDLNGFWKTTYFEVRKELRRRYPKHSWPDDPLSQIPRKATKEN